MIDNKIGISRQEKARFIFVCAVTFILGLIAHAYAYFSADYSHDSLTAVYATLGEDQWKFALGRIFVPIYRTVVRGKIALPWIIGLLSLLWVSISVYLVVKMFQLESKPLITLLSGVMVTNVTVTALTGSFLYELDFDMVAVVMATLAAYFWKTNKHWYIGALFVMLSLGFYQSYISVTIGLIMIACIGDLLQGVTAQRVFSKGMKAIVMLLCGGVLYILALKVSEQITGIPLAESYHGMNHIGSNLTLDALKVLIPNVYKEWFYMFFIPKVAYGRSFFAVVNTCLFGLAGIVSVCALLSRRISFLSKSLFLLLMLLLPIGTNVSYILGGGLMHDLMCYAFWLVYLLVILMVRWAFPDTKVTRIVHGFACIMTFLIIWNNILLANTLYLKKDFEHRASLSYMTRVVERLESMPGYVPGESPVIFVGWNSDVETMIGFEETSRIIGAAGSAPISYNWWTLYSNYFEYYLNTEINLDTNAWYTTLVNDPRLAQMPTFPSADSIQIVDGVYVVKLGE